MKDHTETLAKIKDAARSLAIFAAAAIDERSTPQHRQAMLDATVYELAYLQELQADLKQAGGAIMEMKAGDKVIVVHDLGDSKNVGRKAVIMELTKTKLAKIRYANSAEIDYVMIEHIRGVKS